MDGDLTTTTTATTASNEVVYPCALMWASFQTENQEAIADDRSKNAMLTRLVKSQQIVINEQKRTCQDLQARQKETEASTQTEKEQILGDLNTARVELEKAGIRELSYCCLLYNIRVCKQDKTITEDQRKDVVMRQMLKWLAQRQSFVRYLRENSIFTDVADDAERVLFITELELTTMVADFIIPSK